MRTVVDAGEALTIFAASPTTTAAAVLVSTSVQLMVVELRPLPFPPPFVIIVDLNFDGIADCVGDTT